MKRLRMRKRFLGISIIILSIIISQIPITVRADESSEFVIENGVLVKYNGSGGDVIIPDTVTVISNDCFKNGYYGNAQYIDTITIPSSIVQIGNDSSSTMNIWNCFLGAEHLKQIIVDENNAIYSSVDGVLYNKDKSEVLYVPQAYTGMSGEWNIPEGTITIGNYAYNTNGIVKINIPSSLQNIPMKMDGNNFDLAFDSQELKEINVHKCYVEFK